MTVTETGTVLDRIVAQTAIDLERRKHLIPPVQLERALASAAPVVDVLAALNQPTVTVISEVKRASPSKGRFPVNVIPGEVAAEYVAGGASMISCLTDEPFFQGSLDDLDDVVAVAGAAQPPIGVLRKDFIIDRYQIDEARLHGASCILLIVACLTDDHLRELHDHARSRGMAVLVEIHDEIELERALQLSPVFVGINNRNLKTMSVDLATTERLAPRLPGNVLVAGESGIFSREDVRRMAEAGVDAILVGESLILQTDRAAAVRKLQGIRKSPRD